MPKSRLPEWDFIKGVLIILVVWGHVCSYISGDGYEKNFFTAAIRLFQMPMFIFISGYFQRNYSTLSDVKNRVITIVSRLVIPYCIWILVGVCCNYLSDVVFNTLTIGGYWSLLKLCITQANVLWYLGCLILCEFFYCILSWISRSKRHILLLVSLFISVLIPKDIWHFSFMWFWFVLGVLWKEIDQRFTEWVKKNYLIPFCVLLLFLAQLFPTQYTFYNYSNYVLNLESMWIIRLAIIVGRYICYGIMTIAFMMLFKKAYYYYRDMRIVKSICNIGQNTLGIFIIHIIVLYYTVRPYVHAMTSGKGLIPDFPFVRYYVIATIISMIAIIGAYYATIALKKTKVASKLLLGQ